MKTLDMLIRQIDLARIMAGSPVRPGPRPAKKKRSVWVVEQQAITGLRWKPWVISQDGFTSRQAARVAMWILQNGGGRYRVRRRDSFDAY